MQYPHSASIAIAVLLFAGAAAAQPAPSAQPHDHSAVQSDSPALPAGRDAPPLTITGCVMRRSDVSAAGGAMQADLRHHVVVGVHTVVHHQGSGGMRSTASAPASHDHAAQPTGTGGTLGEPGAGSANERIADSQMFTVVGVPSEELIPLEGKRVEVIGRIDTKAVKDTAGGDPDAAPLVVEKIRAVAGTCPQRER